MKHRLNYGLASEDAADALLSTEQSRGDALRREDHLIRRAEFESHHRDEQIDLERTHGLAMGRLQEDQKQRDGEFKQSLLDQQQQLEGNLQAQGLRKFVRDVSGRSEKDRAAQENVQRSIDDMQHRHQSEIDVLQIRHDQEEQARRDVVQTRAAYLAENLLQENQHRTVEQRQQTADARESVTPANMNEEATRVHTHRPAAVEQQNKLRLAPDFNGVDEQAEISPTREAYIAENSQAAIDNRNSPSQEFGHVAPNPQPSHER